MASKHFFAGSQRIATKMVKKEQNGNSGNIVLEKEQYYYHPDHLGSSSFVTDEKGKVYEHLEYFPFGETFAHEHSNTQVTPYRFTGKELDEVTGLYYYGARYYDPRTSVWQSPDPIIGEYMSGKTNGGVFNPKNLSLFTYTANNPVNLVDPDGNRFEFGKAVAGDQKQEIMDTMQKLTADTLSIKGNEIVISNKGGTSAWTAKNNGSKLIERMANSERTATLNIASPGSGNSESDMNSVNAINGIGSDVQINFDPASNPNIKTLNPKTGLVSGQKRPNQIGLGHELIHGDRSMRGSAIDYGLKGSQSFKNSVGTNMIQNVPQEELATVGLGYNSQGDITENQLRQESSQNPRGAY